jgi:hypothetical protein
VVTEAIKVLVDAVGVLIEFMREQLQAVRVFGQELECF